MSILTFNFHQIAGVQIESEDPGLLEFFKAEYRPSSSPLLQGIPKVSLNWSRSNWPFTAGYQIQLHKCLARWSYKISFHENAIQIDAIGNQTAVPMVHHMLVHPSLRYLCAQKDALMLHGSAVVFNDKSLVFTGVGGAGKTTISSLILRYGGEDWRLHADDYVFLSPGPKSFSYMTRSHLYRDQIRWVPAIRDLLSSKERMHLEFFGRLREITKDRIKWPLRIEPSRLWPEHSTSRQAQLAAILILSRDEVDQLSLERLEVTEEIVQELVQMNFYEARHFIKLVKKVYGEAILADKLEPWKERELDLLNRILQEAPLFRLNLPLQVTSGDRFGKDLVDILKPLTNLSTENGPNA
jgi:hypothetical protein